jgi:hypothetical protein
MMTALHSLVVQRKVTGFKDFKSIVYLSMLWVKFRDELRSVSPPYLAMRLMNSLGKLLNYQL